MSDVLEVEVDGDIDHEHLHRVDDVPRWGLAAGVGVVGLLVAALLVLVVAPALRGGGVPVEDRNSKSRDEVVEAARSALGAWGRFAVTGDLDLLAGHFDPDGPQYEQLAAEAPALVAGQPNRAPYTVDLDVRDVDRSADEALVTGRVRWARAGETDQLYEWAIELRPANGRWLLWTVHLS